MNESNHFIGTRPVLQQHAVDTAALAVWLQANLEGFRGPVDVEMFKGGQSNPTYLVTTSGHRYVMRAKPGPAARLLPSAHAIEREFKVLRALEGSGVPVPRVLCLCEDENVIGRAFYIMEFVEGRVLWDQALPGRERTERAAVYDEMNRVIAALHTVDFASRGLADYGRPGNYFQRQIARWHKQYRASGDSAAPVPDMDRLAKWLPAHLPPSAFDKNAMAIVHGDYRLDNLVFHASEPRAIAVLDWELSTLGHPLADFSYHCMAWHFPPGPLRGIAGLDPGALGVPSEDEYIVRYCERTGRSDIAGLRADWNFYLAYNFFRSAAILHGIAQRSRSGTASSANPAASLETVAWLAERGWEMALTAS